MEAVRDRQHHALDGVVGQQGFDGIMHPRSTGRLGQGDGTIVVGIMDCGQRAAGGFDGQCMDSSDAPGSDQTDLYAHEHAS